MAIPIDEDRPVRRFELVPAVAPARGQRGGLYDEILLEFIDSGLVSARVEVPGASYKTIQIGLVKATGRADAPHIKARVRKGEVFLIREKM